MNFTEEPTPPVPSPRPAEEIRADLLIVRHASEEDLVDDTAYRLWHDIEPLLARLRAAEEALAWFEDRATNAAESGVETAWPAAAEALRAALAEGASR